MSVLCQTTTPRSAAQIRSVREEIDKAFQRHDAKQLATFVSSDCHFTAPSLHVDDRNRGGGPLLYQDLQRVCAEEPGSQPRYFPTGVFENPDIDQWWNCTGSRLLAAVQEVQLWPAPRDLEAYRFFWLRTLGHSVVIRVERRANDVLLVAKEARRVENGFEPSELVVDEVHKVTREQWLWLKELLQKAKSPQPPVLTGAFDNTLGLREQWTLEGIKSGKYQVDVWQSRHAPAAIRELISYLVSMAGIAVRSNDLPETKTPNGDFRPRN